MHIAVIGASGALGSALVNALDRRDDVVHIDAYARQDMSFASDKIHCHPIDLERESTIEYAAAQSAQYGPLDMILIATGMLHEGSLMPEKALRDLDAEKASYVFAVNTIGPALVMKHFLPLIPKDSRSICAAFSARVGSISDNHLGGWHSYRASKAALNMMIKNASIELGRRFKHSIIIGLHPGTVDSALSKPFQSHVPAGKLFAPEDAAAKLLAVIDARTPQDSGKCFAWDGSEIPF